MALSGKVPLHPAEFSQPILDVLATLIRPGEHVHDPFCGRGVRLGALCDRIGATFTGTDIEVWRDSDSRAQLGDSTMFVSYPTTGSFAVVTSPVYFANRISSDYVAGPTPTTKAAGRRSYGISLGRALDPANAARVCRSAQLDQYLELHSDAMKHWSNRVLLNVDSPMLDAMTFLLVDHGYDIVDVYAVGTQRYRVGSAGRDRASHEVVIEAVR